MKNICNYLESQETQNLLNNLVVNQLKIDIYDQYNQNYQGFFGY